MSAGSQLPEAEQPLLHNRPAVDPESLNAAEAKNTWGADLQDIVRLAGPAILQLSFQQAVIVTNQSMAGHLGSDELAAAAISATWFNLMWFFIIGASSALDTLASQAFGAEDRQGVIQWAVSATAILSLLAVPMAVALHFADVVAANVFQQPPEIARLVGVYCNGILPGLWPFIWSLIMMKAMQAQNMMWGPTLVTIGMFGANILINLGLIHLFGFTGAAYAQSVSRIALFIFLLVYISTFGKGCIQFERPAWHPEEGPIDDVDQSTSLRIRTALEEAAEQDEAHPPPPRRLIHDSAGSSPPGKTWGSPKEGLLYAPQTLKQTVKDGLSGSKLLTFLQLGVAGGLMIFKSPQGDFGCRAADASSFDITTAMAGFIGVEEVGAHTSLLTIIEFIFTSFPYGIATAATIRVGNMLGAGRATSARQSAYLCLAGCACFNITVMILFFVFGDYVGRIFTDNHKVIRLVAKLSVLAGLYQIPDCIYGSVSGILRGAGRQASLMWSNLAGFWGIGMPICYVLAFKFGYGVEGLWIGLVTGVTSSALLVLIMLLLLDWKKEAAEAQKLPFLVGSQEVEGEAADDYVDDSFPSEMGLGATGSMDGSRGDRARSRTAPRAVPAVQPRSPTHPQLSVGSLTGSYARQINSHL